MNKEIKLTGLRTNDKIISESISFLSSNFRVLFLPLIKITLPVLLIIMVAESYLSFNYFKGGSSLFDYLLEGSYYSAAGSVFSYMLISLFVLSGLTLHYRGEVISPGSIMRTVRVSGLPFIFLTLLFFIAAAFSVILLFVPVLFLYVLYSIATAEVVVEEVPVFNSIRKAHQLLKRNYWKTFWLSMILGIIQFFMGFVFELPATFFQISLSLHDAVNSPGFTDVMILQLIELSSRFAYLFSIIFWTGIYMQYFNLREMKQGDVLLNQIEQKFGNH